jgi:hypothetical protein
MTSSPVVSHSFSARPTLDLLQLVQAGSGFRLDAGARPTLDLVQIAQAAALHPGIRVVFAGLNARPTHDLLQIAQAGSGCVFFEG